MTQEFTPAGAVHTDAPTHRTHLNRGSETKPSFKTTELAAYVVVLLGILLASYLVDGNAGGDDPFSAEQAWRYITFLTIGYMVSRGLAKSGSREPHEPGQGKR